MNIKMPRNTDYVIYSSCAPNHEPRCLIWSKDRNVSVSRTGASVQEAIDAAKEDYNQMQGKRIG